MCSGCKQMTWWLCFHGLNTCMGSVLVRELIHFDQNSSADGWSTTTYLCCKYVLVCFLELMYYTNAFRFYLCSCKYCCGKTNRYSCFYNLHMVFSELLDVQSMAERFAAGTSRHSLSGFYLLFMAWIYLSSQRNVSRLQWHGKFCEHESLINLQIVFGFRLLFGEDSFERVFIFGLLSSSWWKSLWPALYWYRSYCSRDMDIWIGFDFRQMTFSWLSCNSICLFHFTL